MANWITCEYHGASIDPSRPNKGLPINDEPVNLDLCETIKRVDVPRMKVHQLIFHFSKNPAIVWQFINEKYRDLEYNRALELIKAKQ